MEPTIFRKTILRNFFFIKNDVSSCHFRTSIGYKLIRKKKNNTARFRSWDLRLMRTIRYHCATVLLHGLAKKNACTMIFSSWIIINPKYMNCWATKAWRRQNCTLHSSKTYIRKQHIHKITHTQTTHTQNNTYANNTYANNTHTQTTHTSHTPLLF